MTEKEKETKKTTETYLTEINATMKLYRDVGISEVKKDVIDTMHNINDCCKSDNVLNK